jgi:hypothetical protein
MITKEFTAQTNKEKDSATFKLQVRHGLSFF